MSTDNPTPAEPGERWVREADAYLRAAAGSLRGARRFDNALIGDILSLAAESYWVGLFRSRGRVPASHTLAAMTREAAGLADVPAWLIERMEDLDRRQNLCALETGRGPAPTDADLRSLAEAVEAIRSVAARGRTGPVSPPDEPPVGRILRPPSNERDVT